MRFLPILLAKPGQPWQSSYLYSYSQRLSWSSSCNAFSQAIERKRQAGAELLDLTISNPTEAFVDYPHDQIREAYGSVRNFAYEPNPAGTEPARAAIASYYKRRGIDISPSRILITASTSEAYGLLFKLFCNPGDEILIPIPSYPLFEYLAALESVHVVAYRLLYDGSWFIDFEHLRNRISDRTRAIVTVNPNNPTGSFLKRGEARALTDLAKERGLPIISDEVFMDYAFESNANRTNTLIGIDSALSFSLNGLSKSAGMPQMKLGWIAMSGPESEQVRARERLELVLDTYLSVGTPVQAALPKLLDAGEGVQGRIAERTNANRMRLIELLRNCAAHPLHTEGGWSCIVQLPNTRTEDEWVSGVLDATGTVVQPGYFFDMTGEAYIVVSLLTAPEIFAEGIRRLRYFLSEE